MIEYGLLLRWTVLARALAGHKPCWMFTKFGTDDLETKPDQIHFFNFQNRSSITAYWVWQQSPQTGSQLISRHLIFRVSMATVPWWAAWPYHRCLQIYSIWFPFLTKRHYTLCAWLKVLMSTGCDWIPRLLSYTQNKLNLCTWTKHKRKILEIYLWYKS